MGDRVQGFWSSDSIRANEHRRTRYVTVECIYPDLGDIFFSRLTRYRVLFLFFLFLLFLLLDILFIYTSHVIPFLGFPSVSPHPVPLPLLL